MAEDTGSVQARSFQILQTLLTRPFARLFWRMSVKKAVKIAKFLEVEQYK
jgi:hypothetical protein